MQRNTRKKSVQEPREKKAVLGACLLPAPRKEADSYLLRHINFGNVMLSAVVNS